VAGLVAAERSFAALARDRGVREAFLSVLAEDGLLFRPRPENGRAHHRATPDDGGLLVWEPVFADLSAAQDLGYTTGPFSLTEPGDVDPRLHGHYVSVWRRLGGGWRLLLDIGIPHPKLARTPDLAFAPEALAPRAQPRRAAARSLLEAEDALSAVCGNRGVQEGYRIWADPRVRAYRSGVAPLRDRAEFEALLAQAPRYALWEVMGHGVAESGDLAWTHGLASSRRSPNLDETPQPQVFLRLWRRRPEGWRVVLDATLPAPDPKQEKGKAP
jgi:ketosteroid isomerase-like protein